MKRLLQFTLPFLLLACDSPVDPAFRASLLVESDDPSYALADRTVPSFTLQHRGGPAVVISGCPAAPSAILERAAGDQWVEEASRGLICPGVHTVQVDTLGAGDSRTFPVAVSRAGTYRLRVLIGPSAASPERTILSNEFDVH